MPGQLKRTACCPVCGDPLRVLVDETTSGGVYREFFHGRKDGAAFARGKCVKTYTDFDLAQRERRALEVRAA